MGEAARADCVGCSDRGNSDDTRPDVTAEDQTQQMLSRGQQMTDPERQIRELTQRIEVLEEELMRAQRLSSVGALASSITHEFNNILTTVINYAKMGLRHTDDSTRTKAFDRILNASQRAAKITTSMLSYSRTSSNRIEPVDLKRLLEEVLVLVQKDLQMHRIQLDVNASATVWAMASASQIQQLLMNLIINARQAMQENGRLRLIVRDNPADGWAEVVVADSGCGIPQEKLALIFDSFYTTKKPDDNGQGGTGLGLALCRRIVEAHRGRIRVESEPGRGTTFTLRLPRCEQAVGFVSTAGTAAAAGAR